MKLLCDGTRLLFSERSLPVKPNLTLLFPFDGTLSVGGAHLISTEKRALSLPLSHLKEGHNVLLFRAEGRAFPVEGLIREGNTLRPAGFPSEETMLRLLSRLSLLEAKVTLLEEQEAKRADPPSLFS